MAVQNAQPVGICRSLIHISHLLALSRRMMRTITLNLVFSMGLNFLAIVLAIPGLLGPVIGALVHNAG